VRLRILGGLELTSTDRTIVPDVTRQTRFVLACLALAGPKGLTRSELCRRRCRRADTNLAMQVPPAEQQATVIEQIKAMMASPDPVQRRLAQLYMQRFGRSFLGAAANAATFGGSDTLMRRDPATEWARLPLSPRQYDPG
jgi:hypothetical protein